MSTPAPAATPSAAVATPTTAAQTPNPSATPLAATTQPHATTYPTLTATRTPAVDDAVVMGLLSHSDFVDVVGDVHVVGEVRNETEGNLDRISVRIMFYNQWGTVSKIVDGPALMDVLGPRQVTPFVLAFPKPLAWESFTIRVTAQPSADEPVTSLRVTEYSTAGIETGILHVTGTVANEGDKTIQRAQVVVTLYDPWGTVVNAGFANTDPLSPGGEATFDCQFTEYTLMETIAVQVEPD